MKINNLMEKADDYLNSDNRKRKAKIKCLKHVLEKLKKREKKLEKQFKVGKRSKEKISKELAIIHAHRKKGLDILKLLQNEAKKAKRSKKDKGVINTPDS